MNIRTLTAASSSVLVMVLILFSWDLWPTWGLVECIGAFLVISSFATLSILSAGLFDLTEPTDLVDGA